MLLSDSPAIGFLPTRNPEAARTFFEHTLGLRFESDDNFALVFRLGPAPGTMLRVVRAPAYTPLPFTLFGWEVADLEQTVDQLTARGLAFERFGHFEQDDRAIWHAPGGVKIAWFKDPDGNLLSLSQHSL